MHNFRLTTVLMCFLSFSASLKHANAAPRSPDRKTPKAVRVVSIHFGQWAGMCYGYCSTELEVSAGEAVLHQKAWGPVEQRRYPARQVRADLSDKHWKELQQLVDHVTLISLPDKVGCPDCTDGGAESVEVKFSDRTSKKITFDMGVPPKELKDLADMLRTLESKLLQEFPPK
jgi:hypothetical protein